MKRPLLYVMKAKYQLSTVNYQRLDAIDSI